jgi:hypothetical protein
MKNIPTIGASFETISVDGNIFNFLQSTDSVNIFHSISRQLNIAYRTAIHFEKLFNASHTLYHVI